MNTDNRLMSNTTVSEELLICHQRSGLTFEDICRVIINGFKSSFCSLALKRQLIRAACEELRNVCLDAGIEPFDEPVSGSFSGAYSPSKGSIGSEGDF